MHGMMVAISVAPTDLTTVKLMELTFDSGNRFKIVITLAESAFFLQKIQFLFAERQDFCHNVQEMPNYLQFLRLSGQSRQSGQLLGTNSWQIPMSWHDMLTDLLW